MAELAELALTAGLDPVERLTCKRQAPDAALFVGSGKAQEIKALAEARGATEILFDQALSPAQQRNLERELTDEAELDDFEHLFEERLAALPDHVFRIVVGHHPFMPPPWDAEARLVGRADEALDSAAAWLKQLL